MVWMFTGFLALVFIGFYAWLFRVLPRERWQFAASLPLRKSRNGNWVGLNITWYGVFTGLAGGVAVTVFLLLMFSIGVPLAATMMMVLAVLLVCIPSASLIVRVVERKNHGFSVGGASFVGIVIAPFVIQAVNIFGEGWLSGPVPVVPSLAAMAIAYCIGEGMGRLGCISFGCCHGKAVDDLSVRAQKWFKRLYFVFEGTTKKIAWASRMDQVRVVPIQAITCVMLTLAGLVAMGLFLNGWFAPAFIGAIVFSQLWRLGSEMLRADYRGGGSVTVYQWMAVVACFYTFLVLLWMPVPNEIVVSLKAGLVGIWNPVVVLAVQAISLVMAVNAGISTVTTSEIRYGIEWENT